MEVPVVSALLGWTRKLTVPIRLTGLLLAFTLCFANTAFGQLLRLNATEHTDVRHTFTGMAKSFGVTVTNLTDHVVTIEREILIEKETSLGWVQGSGVQAIAACADFDTRYNRKAQIRLNAHDTLAVVPWDGFACAGQCMEGCLSNAPPSPGKYRFVVVIASNGERFVSPPFTISLSNPPSTRSRP